MNVLSKRTLRGARTAWSGVCAGARAVQRSLAVPVPDGLDRVLRRPMEVPVGAYACRVRRADGLAPQERAALKRELGGLEVEARAALRREDVPPRLAARLRSGLRIYKQLREDDLGAAVVTVRSAAGCLMGVACVTESSMAHCVDLDLMAAAPRALLGDRPPGPTPGEAALTACVWLSLQAGYGGAVEAQSEATARGWYAAHGFAPGSLGHLRLRPPEAWAMLRRARLLPTTAPLRSAAGAP
jgi:hypothetical protein